MDKTFKCCACGNRLMWRMMKLSGNFFSASAGRRIWADTCRNCASLYNLGVCSVKAFISGGADMPAPPIERK